MLCVPRILCTYASLHPAGKNTRMWRSFRVYMQVNSLPTQAPGMGLNRPRPPSGNAMRSWPLNQCRMLSSSNASASSGSKASSSSKSDRKNGSNMIPLPFAGRLLNCTLGSKSKNVVVCKRLQSLDSSTGLRIPKILEENALVP